IEQYALLDQITSAGTHVFAVYIETHSDASDSAIDIGEGEHVRKLLEGHSTDAGIGYGVELLPDRNLCMIYVVRDNSVHTQTAIVEQLRAMLQQHFKVQPTLGVGSVYDDLS